MDDQWIEPTDKSVIIPESPDLKRVSFIFTLWHYACMHRKEIEFHRSDGLDIFIKTYAKNESKCSNGAKKVDYISFKISNMSDSIFLAEET